VLGCGPAGLMAAHAATLSRHEVVILSKARPSYMKGAQYLHRPIPIGVDLPSFQVTYDLLGTPEGYRRKVYGEGWQGTVSPEDLTESHEAWDIRVAYQWLWDMYGERVTDQRIDPGTLDEAIQHLRPDVTISTVPASILCMEGHTFGHTMIWSTDQPMIDMEQNWVVCNGLDAPAWYRAARIQNFDTVEWPLESKPPLSQDHLWAVHKPTKNNCTCFPDVVRMGRYGKWTKGVLSHEAFHETAILLNQKQEKLF
jgi:hypothetical protein